MTSLQNRISALPPELREQVRRRLAGQSERSDQIPTVPREGAMPLSFARAQNGS